MKIRHVIIVASVSLFFASIIFATQIWEHSKKREVWNQISHRVSREKTSFFDVTIGPKIVELADSSTLVEINEYLYPHSCIKKNLHNLRIRYSPFDGCEVFFVESFFRMEYSKYFQYGSRAAIAVYYDSTKSVIMLREGDLAAFNAVAKATFAGLEDEVEVPCYVKLFLLSVGYMAVEEILILRSVDEWEAMVVKFKKAEKRRKEVKWHYRESVNHYYNDMYWEPWEDKEYIKWFEKALENRLIQGPIHYYDAIFLQGPGGETKRDLPIYVKDDIKPPEISKTEYGWYVEFYCWTVECGNFDYWRIKIMEDGQIEYKLDRQAEGVGPYRSAKRFDNNY